MSWSTVTIGSIVFKRTISARQRARLLEKLKSAACLEVNELEFVQRHDDWSFCSLKWGSSVEGRMLTSFFKKHRQDIEHFSFDIHRITDADESFYFNHESGVLSEHILQE